MVEEQASGGHLRYIEGQGAVFTNIWGPVPAVMDQASSGGLAGSDCRRIEDLHDSPAPGGLPAGLLHGLYDGRTKPVTSCSHRLSSYCRYMLLDFLCFKYGYEFQKEYF